MRKTAVILFLLFIGFQQINAQDKQKSDFSVLLGTWKVDLRPTPDAAEYFQEFVIEKIEGKTFTGKFYGSEIKNGKINGDWETIYLAFTTEDNSGLYSHFAKISGAKLEGATNSLGRNFLLPWRAEKVKKEKVEKEPAAKNENR